MTRLALSGQTDRQIAQGLSVATRTVEFPFHPDPPEAEGPPATFHQPLVLAGCEAERAPEVAVRMALVGEPGPRGGFGSRVDRLQQLAGARRTWWAICSACGGRPVWSRKSLIREAGVGTELDL